MTLQLCKFDVVLPDEVNLALVITGGLGPEEQRHTGFVVRTLTGDCFLFHLGGNNRYKRGRLTENYNYLLVPYLEPEVEMPIIAFLYYLLESTKGLLAYSIAWEVDDYFDDQGQLIKNGPSDGFTCATFVLETFKRYGFDIVDRSTWPIGVDDAAWQRGILDIAGLSSSQFLAQVELVGKFPRFRPEQALGAAHYYVGHKLPFLTVEPAGREVVVEMTRLRA